MSESIRVTMEATSTDFLERWAVGYLRELGYQVDKSLVHVSRRESPKQLSHRLNIHPSTLCARLQEQHCPAFAAGRGPTGRLAWIITTPALEAHITQNKKAKS